MTHYERMTKAQLIHELEVQRDSLERLEAIVDGSRDAVFISDEDSRFVLVNPAACELTGYSEEELLEMRIPDLHEEPDRQAYAAHHDPIMDGQETLTEAEILRKDRTKVAAEFNSRRVVIADSRYMHTVARDVTERKRAEEALRETEARFRGIFENTTSGVAVYGAVDDGEDFIFLDFNPSGEKIDGVRKDELLGKRVTEVFPGVVQMGMLDVLRRVWRTGNPEHFPATTYHDNRIQGWRENFVYRLPDGEVVAVYQDITERKRAEEASRKSEQQLKDAQALGRIGHWEYDVDAETISWSEETFRLYERDPSLGAPSAEEEAVYYTPEQAQQLREHARRTIEDKKTREFDLAAILPSGRVVHLTSSMRPITDERGRVVKLFGIVQDISERKRAEQALHESEARLRGILDATPFPLALVNTRADVIEYWSRSALDAFGHTAPTAAEWYRLAYPDPGYRQQVIDRWEPCVERARRTGLTVHTGEYRVTCHDGSARLCELYVTFLADKFLVAFNDITERKRVEDALRGSEEKYRSLFDQANDIILVLELVPDGLPIIRDANQAALHALGYPRDELVGKPISMVNGADSPEVDVRRIVDRVLGTRATFEVEHRRKDGSVFSVEAAVHDLTVGGRKLGISIERDITERKQAEEALRYGRALLDAQVEASIDGILIVDGQGRQILKNRRVVDLWKIPSDIADDPDDQRQVQHVMHSTKDPERFVELVTHLYHHPDETSRDEIELVDGTVLDRYSAPVVGRDGHHYGRIWTFRDVTERRKMENELRISRDRLRSLTARLDDIREEERTRLARELHDEVGQSLTAMRMDLAAVEAGLPAEQKQLADRLRSMIALAQDSVDRVNRMSSELRSPILDLLGLQAAVEAEVTEYHERWGTEIGLVAGIGNLKALPERDLVVYRVLKEALANVRQHANANRVGVSLRTAEEDLVLEVLDDGIGITDEQAQSQQSFGLIGMRERAGRLGGSVEVERRPEGGTRIRVRVPVAPTREPSRQADRQHRVKADG